MSHASATGRTVDLAGIVSARREDSGAVWSLTNSEDLNANLVRFEEGEGVGLHVNDEVDVLFVGIAGGGLVVVDGEEYDLEPGRMVFAPRGCSRASRAAPGGFAYLTVHRRRGPVRLGKKAEVAAR